MRTKLFYILPFVLAFIAVTGGLIYFNSVYENIFEFNFSSRQLSSSMQDSSKAGIDSTKLSVKNSSDIDSTHSDEYKTRNELDSLLTLYKNGSESQDLSVLQRDSTRLDSIKTITKLLNGKKHSAPDTTRQIAELINLDKQDKNQDPEYLNWIKKISSIYEAMEPRKAAKIIQNYSDNVARDILYTMKKKTAAKVIAELSPETVNRIIRFQ